MKFNLYRFNGRGFLGSSVIRESVVYEIITYVDINDSTMASNCKFKTRNRKTPQNINPVEIKMHTYIHTVQQQCIYCGL